MIHLGSLLKYRKAIYFSLGNRLRTQKLGLKYWKSTLLYLWLFYISENRHKLTFLLNYPALCVRSQDPEKLCGFLKFPRTFIKRIRCYLIPEPAPLPTFTLYLVISWCVFMHRFMEVPVLKVLCYFDMKWQVGIWCLNGSQSLWLLATTASSR